MFTNKSFPSIFRKPYSMTTLALSILMVIATSCNLPAGKSVETQELVDIHARTYRMYYDSSSDAADSELQIRYFTGQLRMADLEELFGDLEDLPTDDNGNHVGGPLLEDGLIWSLVTSPSQEGSNLVTSDLDGMTSSALDIDGDHIVDIVDTRLPDGRRMSFVTEGLGMGIFEAWLQGHNPLCDSSMLQDLGLEGFRCGDQEGSGGEGSAGGGGSVPGGGSGYVDPLDQLCADYNNSPSFGMNRGVVGQPRGRMRSFSNLDFSNEGGSTATVFTAVYEDADGGWTGTTKIIYEYDAGGRLVRTITETVNPDGSGQRTIQVPAQRHEDGSVSLPITKRESFVAHPDRAGDYNGSESDPPTPGTNTDSAGDTSGGSSESPPAEDLPPPPPPPEDGNPGPDPLDDDSSLAALCARRGTPSGVEQAAATDPTAFRVGCGDLVGAPAGGDDCTIIDWAGPGDFEGALEPGNDDGCGEFEVRAPGGDCEPSNAIEILRGRTAMIASANLQGVVICPPIECNPNPVAVAVEAREEISASGVDAEEFVTVTPVVNNNGEISEPALCNLGPGPKYKTVSSLKAGVNVKILGIVKEGGWLIIDNPVYPGVSCWVPKDKVIPNPGFDPSLLLVFSIPGDNSGGNNSGGNNSDGSGNTCVDPYYFSLSTGKCELFE